jgi:hypothetical protein
MPQPSPPPGWIQKQQQIAEEQQRRKELLASMPPAHQHAFQALAAKGIEVREIVRVEVDAILFIGPKGPRTAWLRNGGTAGLRVCVEDGFPVEPGPTARAAFGEMEG